MNSEEFEKFNDPDYCRQFIKKNCKPIINNNVTYCGVITEFKYVNNVRNAHNARWRIVYHKTPRRDNARAYKRIFVLVDEMLDQIDDNFEITIH